MKTSLDPVFSLRMDEFYLFNFFSVLFNWAQNNNKKTGGFSFNVQKQFEVLDLQSHFYKNKSDYSLFNYSSSCLVIKQVHKKLTSYLVILVFRNLSCCFFFYYFKYFWSDNFGPIDKMLQHPCSKVKKKLNIFKNRSFFLSFSYTPMFDLKNSCSKSNFFTTRA